MRSFILAGLLTLLVVWTASPARADVFSVSADVPVTYNFDDPGLRDPSASGIILGVSLPFLVGLGVESYKVTGAADVTPASDYEYKVTMYDIFLNLPFPVANLVLGAGAGNGKLSLASGSPTFGDATLTQLFFSIGIPFAGIFDAHVGYRSISGEADVSDGSKQNLDAQMATIGLKVGF